jgi:meso-butanediol dehydrogenase/(S,S)-butanediol dehydrogenase/diacetyl reductase
MEANSLPALRFANRVAVVTGAASGIGLATARRLFAEGANVVLVDRNSETLTSAAEQFFDPSRTSTASIDVADESAVGRTVAGALAHFGRIDVLCNIAGVGGNHERLATDQELEEWRAVMQVNVYGTVLFTKFVSQAMRNVRRGTIVNTASVAGIRSGAGGNAYSASKAAVISFTQTSACDLGQWGIRVNAVCPGLVETGMTRQLFDHARTHGKEAKLGSRCELRRFGRPEELAAVIAFLASDDASYITGQALAVDGGNTASLNLPGMKV